MGKANDSEHEAAKNAYTFYGWFLQEVAKEVGWDKAVAIHAGNGDKFAGMLGGMVRAKCSQQKPDAECVAAVLENAYKKCGMDYEVQATDGIVTVRVGRCPIYDGLAASGIDHAKIQQLCQGLGGREYEQLKRLVPELAGKVKFRESASDTCLEEFVVAT
ncbi:MAG: hypothetical protein ACE141_09055 [Bryobacteraceae bacterium]